MVSTWLRSLTWNVVNTTSTLQAHKGGDRVLWVCIRGPLEARTPFSAHSLPRVSLFRRPCSQQHLHPILHPMGLFPRPDRGTRGNLAFYSADVHVSGLPLHVRQSP